MSGPFIAEGQAPRANMTWGREIILLLKYSRTAWRWAGGVQQPQFQESPGLPWVGSRPHGHERLAGRCREKGGASHTC